MEKQFLCFVFYLLNFYATSSSQDCVMDNFEVQSDFNLNQVSPFANCAQKCSAMNAVQPMTTGDQDCLQRF